MGEVIRFKITEDEHEMLTNAMRPVPYMVFGGMAPASPQENANAAWRVLGAAYGVVWDSIRPFGPEAIPYEFTGEALPPAPKVPRRVTLDLETGDWIDAPKGGITGEEGARMAASLLPGMTPEAVSEAYGKFMSDDTAVVTDGQATQ